MITALATGAILVVSAVFVTLGLGGGILFVPILHWTGHDLQSVAIPLGLLLNGLNTLLALLPYGRAGLVDWRGGAPIAVSAAATAPLGAGVQPWLASETVLLLFAGAVVLAALRALGGTPKGGGPDESTGPGTGRFAVRLVVGAAVGFVGGLLGIGAGFLVVPVLVALRYPPRRAAATTALVVTVCSFAGVAGYAPTLDLPVGPTLLTVAAVLIGSRIGTLLMLRTARPAWIMRGYAIVLAGVAAMLCGEVLARL
ncbi:sulfite exporter TauE/SafE family protein [Rhodoplanes azumiensis]|uniref:Probable membrane transporter protein n=1 Tax=Rhodoplanes azumiensis TaxID=1897628 RepID=A0ABW5AGD9_9BRAD